MKEKNYLNRLIRLKDTPDIKIITGLRHSGKSELVRAYMELIRTNEDTNIIYVDFADLKFDDLKTYKELYNFCEGQYIDGKTNVIVVDEVQMCEKIELAINSLYNSRKYDIYITGANAFFVKLRFIDVIYWEIYRNSNLSGIFDQPLFADEKSVG